ncbi:MAG: PKD domain-containing protein [bacterium]|nr:PKD domain-containing protein [bacterium]
MRKSHLLPGSPNSGPRKPNLSSRVLSIALVAAAAAALLAGCGEDADLAPVITRVQANIDCGVAPTEVQFVAFVSGGDPGPDPTGANTNLDILWNFQDGATGTGSTTHHLFAEPGIYEVAVTVTDDDGDSKSSFVTVEIRDDSLTVMAAPDTTVTASLAYFPAHTIGASNGGVGGETFRTRPVINEILAFNTVLPNPENLNRLDPVLELHNPTGAAISLGNWSLSNDPYDRDKFLFATTVSIPAHGYYRVWLNGRGQGTGTTQTNFNLLLGYTGAPADFVADIYLYDANRNLVDSKPIRNSATNVSFGHVPDACTDGTVLLSATAAVCGFDPELGQFDRFDFLWRSGSVLESAYPERIASHMFTVQDAGLRPVVVSVFDTYLSVTRHDTVMVEVLAPAAP